jgi:murein L,D-transpeptidase YafK
VLSSEGPKVRALTLILIVALTGAGFYLLTPAGRQLLDRARITMTRWDNQSRYRSGRPLPGTPDLARLDERLAAHGVKLGVPVVVRIFKLESELELWVEKDGRFVRFATYPVCLWSGRLGPKVREGDRQAPEGFYTVAAEQLNPDSRWHRAFNLGFPNAFDRANRRNGSFIMVHGGCSSIGCFAMTNQVVDELWQFVTAALDQGEGRVPVHVFPFRMTDRNLAARKGNRWGSFWAALKKGYDLFEARHMPPVVSVCEGRYVFEPGSPETVGRPVEERCPPEVAGNP